MMRITLEVIMRVVALSLLMIVTQPCLADGTPFDNASAIFNHAQPADPHSLTKATEVRGFCVSENTSQTLEQSAKCLTPSFGAPITGDSILVQDPNCNSAVTTVLSRQPNGDLGYAYQEGQGPTVSMSKTLRYSKDYGFWMTYWTLFGDNVTTMKTVCYYR